MNQRIAVRAFVKKDGKILLLKRASGRESILGKYELPGGQVEYGEQPEEALVRHLKEEVGVTLQTAQLSDVFTYIDHDSRDIQYAVVLYSVSIIPSESNIKLTSNYNDYVWRRPSSAHQDELTDLSWMLLGVLNGHIGLNKEKEAKEVIDKTSSRFIVYTDGGSRGNPGPSAAGYAIMDQKDNLIDEGGVYLGITTNNQAEYQGVRIGLEKAMGLSIKTAEFRIDSLLVVGQLNGTYVVKNRELWPIHERIRTLIGQFEKVTFRHVKREYNQRADSMVNKILDEHSNSRV